jgi:hypothetical protein
MSKTPAKGQIVGFAALGVLLLLVAVAFVSSREGGGGSLPEVDLGSGPASLPSPSLTESLPVVPQGGVTVSAEIQEVALSPQASLLAERFRCVCGCGDILGQCTCTKVPGSRDMKQYLQQMVDEGKSPAEIESGMVARYGPGVIP